MNELDKVTEEAHHEEPERDCTADLRELCDEGKKARPNEGQHGSPSI
jgi:hypothetical protein